jgi:hypothetical protein
VLILCRGKHFQETTLWRIFECLVDGITVLEVGNDWTASNEPEATPRPGWHHIVHFDLKPGNSKSHCNVHIVFMIAHQ